MTLIEFTRMVQRFAKTKARMKKKKFKLYSLKLQTFNIEI